MRLLAASLLAVVALACAPPSNAQLATEINNAKSDQEGNWTFGSTLTGRRLSGEQYVTSPIYLGEGAIISIGGHLPIGQCEHGMEGAFYWDLDIPLGEGNSEAGYLCDCRKVDGNYKWCIVAQRDEACGTDYDCWVQGPTTTTTTLPNCTYSTCEGPIPEEEAGCVCGIGAMEAGKYCCAASGNSWDTAEQCLGDPLCGGVTTTTEETTTTTTIPPLCTYSECEGAESEYCYCGSVITMPGTWCCAAENTGYASEEACRNLNACSTTTTTSSTTTTTEESTTTTSTSTTTTTTLPNCSYSECEDVESVRCACGNGTAEAEEYCCAVDDNGYESQESCEVACSTTTTSTSTTTTTTTEETTTTTEETTTTTVETTTTTEESTTTTTL